LRTEKGDIVLVPFPYTDLTGQKLRPCLILYNGQEDVTVAFITSQIKWQQSEDVLLKRSESNGSKSDSILILHKISTVSKDLIRGYIGSADQNMLEEIDRNLISIFKIQIEK
jgi:mRNA interferase MazF